MTSTKLVGNSIGKPRLSVEHPKQNITYSENNAGSRVLTSAFNRYLSYRNAKQLSQKTNTLGGLSILLLKCPWNVNS